MLTITAVAAIAGLMAGYAFKGRVRHIGDVRLVGAPLVFLALGIMVFEVLVDVGKIPDRVLVALGYLLIAAFIVANVRRASGALRIGLMILALGWLLNAAVMLPNGGMPLSLDAYAASGQTEAPTPGAGGFFKIVVADDDTVLSPLGDVIPIRPVHQVLSIGDLVLMAGLMTSIAAAMQPAGSRRRGAQPAAASGATSTPTSSRRPMRDRASAIAAPSASLLK